MLESTVPTGSRLVVGNEVLATLEPMEMDLVGRLEWYERGIFYAHDFHVGMLGVSNHIYIGLRVNATDGLTRISVDIDPVRPIELHALHLTLRLKVPDDAQLLLNGYQSWTETRLFTPGESIPKLRAPFAKLLNTTGDYTFYPYPAKPGQFHSWSITTLSSPEKDMQVWLDEMPETGYTVFQWDCGKGTLQMTKDVGGRKLEPGKTVMLSLLHWEEAGTEITRMPTAKPRPVKAPATGWTSWYNYYTKITEEVILDNLRAFGLREMPIDVFQIDDGWQPAVGDWTSANKKFPQGMAFLADQIHRYGYKAGLWLAPLIVEKDSAIYQLHRDWLVTHDGERLVEAGYNPGWGGLFNGTYYVLDIELPDVQAHLQKVFDTVLLQWGFDLVKLDFLFAAALIPRNGKSRGQLMVEACAFLRRCCGDKLILGCGVPMAPAWNVFDYCRIGPDIGLNWDMHSGKLIHMRERISTYNACGNTIARRHFSGRFFANDPDVFILRDHNNELSPQQKNSLLLINHIFGDLLFTSDDIGSYDDATMRLYRSTFPARAHKVTRVEQDGDLYRMWFETPGEGNRPALSYFAAANLGRLDKKIELPAGNWYRNGEGFVERPEEVYFKPFETRVYLQQSATLPAIVGSDLHIFPGAEIDAFTGDANGITLQFSPHSKVSGKLVLALGDPGLAEAQVNGKPYKTFHRNQLSLVLLSVVDGQLSAAE